MKRISPLNAKGSVENNVCPFINKEKEQLTKSSLPLVLFDCPLIFLQNPTALPSPCIFRLMPVLASAHRRKALFLILVQLCTCRDSVIYHQKVQSLMTVFLVYC